MSAMFVQTTDTSDVDICSEHGISRHMICVLADFQMEEMVPGLSQATRLQGNVK